MRRQFIIGLSVVALLATTAAAAPVTLLTSELTKFKYVNYEYWLDIGNETVTGLDVSGNTQTITSTPGDGIINAGDKFFGILKTEAITNTTGAIDLSAQLLNLELTGVFRFTVVGVDQLGLTSPGHLNFALRADGLDPEGVGITGDFLNYYVGTGATKNWNPADIADANSNGVPDSIDHAMDGMLWTSTSPGTFFEGINDTIVSPVGLSVNRNWANFTVNNSGYLIVPQMFPEAIPLPGSVVHTYLGALHTAGHTVDYYFETKLQGSDLGNWMFRSEDPAWLKAVPEPGTIVLLGAGVLGLGLLRFRRKRA